MNLFVIKNLSQTSKLNLLELMTPMGKLHFLCELNGTLISKKMPQRIEYVNEKTLIFSWQFENAYLEFLQSSFKPTLPSGMEVDNCIAGIWRVTSSIPITLFKFSCCLESEIEGSPETGEGLAAQSFENGDLKLTIGTEDEEEPNGRAILGNWFPIRFKDKIDYDMIKYMQNGIEIVLPECFANESIQVRFIVAWSSKSVDDVSTWFAVDESYKEIFNQAGIELNDLHTSHN